MNQTRDCRENKDIPRRTFLQIAVIGAACLMTGFPRLTAGIEREDVFTNPGKPKLTAQALNNLAAAIKRDPRLATLARQDWRMLVKSEFSLTAHQLRTIDAIPAAKAAQLQTAINRALSTKGEIMVNAQRRPKGSVPGAVDISVVEKQSAQSGPQPRMKPNVEVRGGGKGNESGLTKWDIWVEVSFDC